MTRPLQRARIRVVALEPGGPVGLSPLPKLDPQTKRALTDMISGPFEFHEFLTLFPPGHSIYGYLKHVDVAALKRRVAAVAAVVGLALVAASCSALPVTAFTRISTPNHSSATSDVEWYAAPAALDREVRIAAVRADGAGPHPTLLILPGSDGLHDEVHLRRLA